MDTDQGLDRISTQFGGAANDVAAELNTWGISGRIPIKSDYEQPDPTLVVNHVRMQTSSSQGRAEIQIYQGS